METQPVTYQSDDSPTLVRVHLNKKSPETVMLSCNPLETPLGSDTAYADLAESCSDEVVRVLLFEDYLAMWGGLARWADLNAGKYMEYDVQSGSAVLVSTGKTFTDKDTYHKDVTLGCYALRNAESAVVSNLLTNEERVSALGVLGQKYNIIVGNDYAFNVTTSERSMEYIPDSWTPRRY